MLTDTKRMTHISPINSESPRFIENNVSSASQATQCYSQTTYLTAAQLLNSIISP